MLPFPELGSDLVGADGRCGVGGVAGGAGGAAVGFSACDAVVVGTVGPAGRSFLFSMRWEAFAGERLLGDDPISDVCFEDVSFFLGAVKAVIDLVMTILCSLRSLRL